MGFATRNAPPARLGAPPAALSERPRRRRPSYTVGRQPDKLPVIALERAPCVDARSASHRSSVSRPFVAGAEVLISNLTDFSPRYWVKHGAPSRLDVGPGGQR